MRTQAVISGQQYQDDELRAIAKEYRRAVERATDWRLKGVVLSSLGVNPTLVVLSPDWSKGTDESEFVTFIDRKAQASLDAYRKIQERMEMRYPGILFGVAAWESGEKLARELMAAARELLAMAFPSDMGFAPVIAEKDGLEKEAWFDPRTGNVYVVNERGSGWVARGTKRDYKLSRRTSKTRFDRLPIMTE